MIQMIAALVSGLLFGFGLTVSQMVNPAKVIAFLDVTGNWDPSLAIVMATAIPVTMIGYTLTRRFPSPLAAPGFNPTTRQQIDWPLIAGAVLFGLGWGLVGYCPGPALASILLGNSAALLFAVSMLAGMAAYGAAQFLRTHRAKHA